MADDADKTLATNRRARHDYHIDDVLEAGIVLTGTEIKSLRSGRASLQNAYAVIEAGEAWLVGVHIAEYEQAGYATHDPLRRRKLLLHRKEIARLGADVRQKGYTLIPLRLYLRDGWAKVELGVARGKKLYDKRESIRERDTQREMDREIARRGR